MGQHQFVPRLIPVANLPLSNRALAILGHPTDVLIWIPFSLHEYLTLEDISALSRTNWEVRHLVQPTLCIFMSIREYEMNVVSASQLGAGRALRSATIMLLSFYASTGFLRRSLAIERRLKISNPATPTPISDLSQNSPLWNAILACDIPFIEMLLCGRTQFSVEQNIYGNAENILFAAARTGQTVIVRFIRANIPRSAFDRLLTMINPNRQNPIQIALREGHMKCVRALKEERSLNGTVYDFRRRPAPSPPPVNNFTPTDINPPTNTPATNPPATNPGTNPGTNPPPSQ